MLNISILRNREIAVETRIEKSVQSYNNTWSPNSIILLVSDLRRVLKVKKENEIPVISVVAIMGTTEESAVDPLTDILDLRDKFRKQVSAMKGSYVNRISLSTVCWGRKNQ